MTNIYQYAVDDIITFNNLLYTPLENKISVFSPSYAKLAMWQDNDPFTKKFHAVQTVIKR